MSVASLKPSPSQAVSKSAGQGCAPAGEIDVLAFNLRDTLNSITVREANFGEFLSALKQVGLHPYKQ